MSSNVDASTIDTAIHSLKAKIQKSQKFAYKTSRIDGKGEDINVKHMNSGGTQKNHCEKNWKSRGHKKENPVERVTRKDTKGKVQKAKTKEKGKPDYQHKEPREPEEPEEPREPREHEEPKEPKESKESKESKEPKESKESKGSKGSKGSKESKEPKGSKESKGSKGSKGSKESREFKEPKEPKCPKDPKSNEELLTLLRQTVKTQSTFLKLARKELKQARQRMQKMFTEIARTKKTISGAQKLLVKKTVRISKLKKVIKSMQDTNDQVHSPPASPAAEVIQPSTKVETPVGVEQSTPNSYLSDNYLTPEPSEAGSPPPGWATYQDISITYAAYGLKHEDGTGAAQAAGVGGYSASQYVPMMYDDLWIGEEESEAGSESESGSGSGNEMDWDESEAEVSEEGSDSSLEALEDNENQRTQATEVKSIDPNENVCEEAWEAFLEDLYDRSQRSMAKAWGVMRGGEMALEQNIDIWWSAATLVE